MWSPWRAVGKRVVAADFLHSVEWWLSPTGRRRQVELLAGCNTPADLLHFARDVLGITQMDDEILRFIDVARALEPRRVCEIGTDSGGNNLLLSQVLPSVEQMIGVDLFVRNRIKLHCFRRTGVALSLVDGSSYAANTVQRVARILSENKLDVLFIDGDHSYEGVLADFLSYRQLVRDDGLIVFHDIQPDGRDQGETVAYSGGVPVLWSQLRDHYPAQEFISSPQYQRGLGIGIIRYSSSVQILETLSPSA